MLLLCSESAIVLPTWRQRRTRCARQYYGVIEVIGGRLQAIHLRPFAKRVSWWHAAMARPLGPRSAARRPLLAVLQSAVAAAGVSPAALALRHFQPRHDAGHDSPRPWRCSRTLPGSKARSPSWAMSATLAHLRPPLGLYGAGSRTPHAQHRNFIKPRLIAAARAFCFHRSAIIVPSEMALCSRTCSHVYYPRLSLAGSRFLRSFRDRL